MKDEMSNGGTIQTTKTFFRNGLRTGAEMALLLPFVCIFSITPLVISGTEYAPYAYMTYWGIVITLAASDGRDPSPRVKDLDEPEYVTVRANP